MLHAYCVQHLLVAALPEDAAASCGTTGIMALVLCLATSSACISCHVPIVVL